MLERASFRLHVHLLANVRLGHVFVLLRSVNDDGVRNRRGGAVAALRIVVKHDLDSHTDGTLAEQSVTSARDDVVTNRVTGRNHVTILELHRLRTLAAKLTRDDDLRTLGAGLHDVAKNAVARTAIKENEK